jgi:transposase InsO family protein
MCLQLTKSKVVALRFFKKVNAIAENERECKLLAFRSDRGGKFNLAKFTAFCKENSVRHITTTPYMPQQISVVE